MLPDFYTLKKKLLHKVNKSLRTIIAKESGFVGTISKTQCFEGDRNKIIGSDGEVIQDKKFHEETSTFQVPLPMMDKISPNEIKQKLITMAKDMASAQSKYFFKTMNELIDDAGISVDAKGKKFSIELFLQGLEAIEIDFNADGTPHYPTLVMHPSMEKIAYEEIKKIEEDPEIKKRHDAILQRKRNEWIARENNRKLVG